MDSRRGLSVVSGNVATMTYEGDIEALLRRQHGAVSRAQLRESGISANTIDSWVRRNRLHRILPGVYTTGRRGSPRIARQLASLVPGAASAPEHILGLGLRSAGLTDFLVNEPVLGYVADFLDPARRLIVEVDGYRTHGTWIAFQGDRTRQNVLVAHGYTVGRYTAHDIQTRLASILNEIAEMVVRIGRRLS